MAQDKDREFIWYCQKQASLWLYKQRKGQIANWQVRKNLEALPERDREETRKWLNHYCNLSKGNN